MKNLKIGLLLHFYQPWWQFPYVLAEIANQCYRPILSLIKKTSGFCFSANINYSLLELLDRNFAFIDILSGFKDLVQENKIELLGSSAYHPIFPLIPKDMRITQMEIDTRLKKTLWGVEKNCNGIFLPEMAFSQDILANLKDCNYQWTVLDDEVFRLEYNNRVPYDRVVSLSGFKIFLRSNLWSNKIAHGKFESFYDMAAKMEIEIPKWTGNKPAYLILALDAETFGYHHKHLMEKFLEPMIKIWGKSGSGIIAPLEEIGNYFPSWDLIRMADTSWSASEKDFCEGDVFPLWNSKHNVNHQNLWQLVNIAVQYMNEPGASWDCMKIVSSCHFWWISGRPWWNPEFMKFGAIKAMRIIDKYGAEREKKESRKIFEKLIELK